MTVRDAKFTTEVNATLAVQRTLAESKHVLGREFGAPVAFARNGIDVPGGSPLDCAVGGVFSIGAQPQVCGIAADAVIAGVTNTKISGDVPVDKGPDRSMRHLDVWRCAKPGDAVSASIDGTSPKPALVRSSLGNASPKAALLTKAVTTAAGRPTVKDHVALFTGTLGGHFDLLTSSAAPGVYQHRPALLCLPNSTKTHAMTTNLEAP
jgi:hypothetical protein